MKTYNQLGIIMLIAWASVGWAAKEAAMNKMEIATLGGGCFWCVEAVYQTVPGVQSVTSGYAGGTVDNPTYRQVSRGDTGHAEVAQIVFDPAVITYEEILDIFWKAHDPTQLNRQGADVGTQYRSVIFTHTPEQQKIAEASKTALSKSGQYARPVVTEIKALPTFYPAEPEHQDYYQTNPNVPYSRYVIEPKLKKLKKD